MSLVNILVYFIAPLFLAGYFFLRKKFAYFDDNGIPHIKPSSWILGNMGGVGKTIHMAEFLRNVYNECKGKDVIAGFYGLFVPTIIITDLELIKQITVKDFNNFADRGMYVNEENEPITGHLFAIGGERWRFLRNKLSPVFTSGKIKSMYNTIARKGENFIDAIERASASGSVDMKETSNRFTIDVVSSCAFGMEPDTLKGQNKEFLTTFEKIFGDDRLTQLKTMILSTFPNFSKLLSLKMFDESISGFFNNIVCGTIKYRETNKVSRNDFLNMLIQLKNKGSIDGEISTETKKLTLNECVAQAFIFFFAGADTTSTVITYAMTELALNIDVQDKLRKEINDKVKSDDGKITYDNLHEMTYLNQVVNETIRKFPPAFLTFRQASNDYKIPGSKHIIKKGSQVMIPNIGIHYDERYWKNPEDFNPDRFSAEESAKRPNLAFMPFGEGPRNCIGRRFAQVNVNFAVATMIRNFKVAIDSTKTQLPLKFDLKNPSLNPAGGSWVFFEKINY